MLRKLTAYASDDSGAVTVDWVVLTAAIVGLGMLALTPIAYSTENIADNTGALLDSVNAGYGNQ
jgi:hypothetical protein